MLTTSLTLVRAPNPGPLTGPGTNTWIFGLDEVVVIDPGPLDEEHLRRVVDAAAQVGRVAAVLCTHHHEDHQEGALRLTELTGAPLAVFHRRADRVGNLPLHDQDRILAGRTELVAIHTPGHSSDHLCFLAERERLLFTGDLVLSGTTSVIWPPDGDMGQYLDSLARVSELAVDRLLPGHGEPIDNPGAALETLIRHRQEREAEVLRAFRDGPRRPADLVPELYAGYPEEVLPYAGQTVLAHCLKLAAEGRLRPLGDGPDQVFAPV
ncbi:MAG: MBL fold metallo-hydrolase [Candidatus Dormibacteraeota bacterium]|nr:MBL fold metallo-hydrolase [Candidatus Dormibacteraeota bacterium]